MNLILKNILLKINLNKLLLYSIVNIIVIKHNIQYECQNKTDLYFFSIMIIFSFDISFPLKSFIDINSLIKVW